MVAGELQRYLRLLGIRTPIAGPAGLGETGLNEIVQRHLCRVPFENVSKLLLLGREGAGRVTTLTEFLDGIERYDLGGTCYTSNPFLVALLNALGYDADLLGADMSKPHVHTSIRVRLSGVAYHVDVGYGAPFHSAIRLDRLPWEFEQGRYRFVLDHAAAPEAYQASVYSGEQHLHGYVVHPPARNAGFFDDVAIESYRPGVTFTSMLRIIRFFDDHAADLQDASLSIHRGRQTTSRLLRNMVELRTAVADDLAMPRCPVEEAVAVLEQQTGRSVFEEKGREGAV
ncbi:MAG: arylamine N-acetyltransferase [Bryobacteraceae bacterium]